MSVCVDCRGTFTAQGPWQRRCWPCWREHRDTEQGDARYRAGWRDGFQAAAATTTSPLPARLIRDLLALAHPDRHPPERAELATRATQALNNLRETSTWRRAA